MNLEYGAFLPGKPNTGRRKFKSEMLHNFLSLELFAVIVSKFNTFEGMMLMAAVTLPQEDTRTMKRF